MAAISAVQVKNLREETGLPMMECKSALEETKGDVEEAKLLLQKKYKGKMESRAANVTGEGRVAIFISEDKTSGAIIDLRCETAPVAKTEQFLALADSITHCVASGTDRAPTSEAVRAMPSVTHSGKTVGDEITDAFGVLRENIQLHACRRLEGAYLCGYVHHDGKTGVLIALDAAPNPETVGVDLCHHVAFSNPMAIHRDQIPSEEIDKVRAVAREVAESEGKPAQIIDKIVEGKVNAFCAENALTEQEHVKVSKEKVGDVLKGGGVNAVLDFAMFKIG